MIKGIFDYRFGCDAIPSILRVDKDEVGGSPSTGSGVWAAGAGDLYMHISRAYHVWVEKLKKERDEGVKNALAHGAPTFLLCVMGKSSLYVDMYVAGV